MKKQSHNSKSILNSQITATISVAMVLLMLGIITLSGLSARNVARSLGEEVGFTVIMTDSVTNEGANALGRRLKAAPYTAGVEFISSTKVLERWNAMLGEGDSVLDVNPFLPEWEVRVKAQWAHPDSLEAIAATLRPLRDVEEVNYRSDMAEVVHGTLSTLTYIFIAIAAVLALISFVLISNTVRLSVYSRRLTIHAMRLVGATAGFIRRPFVVSALLGGIVAATVSAAVLGGALIYLAETYPMVAMILKWDEVALTFAGLYAAGAIICTIAALFATNRYLRSDYDDMFN